jgi:hypothetical protein
MYIHIEQQAQLGSPLLRQLGAGLGNTTAAAWEAATSHLDALHLQVTISAHVKQFMNFRKRSYACQGCEVATNSAQA